MSDKIDGKAAQDFEEAMAMMSADPEIRAECEEIAAEFSSAEADGLRDSDSD
ncbi:MAG: hypothetical protein M3542_03525 [Acidobacteriota bacterium]|nr:hypothetical protein [Acidobacteriota bacterium]MDQ5872615.1 hypothetical protein [Acidobacteriota bacterium]